MASAPPKLATAAILLVALWVITYWVTPAPTHQPVKISFGDSPQSAAAETPRPQTKPRADRDPAPDVHDSDNKRVPHGATSDGVLIGVPSQDSSDSTTEVIPPTFRVYYSKRGDTFQSIAGRFFGSSAHWRTIAHANPNIDPNRFGPGTRLLVPEDPENIQGKLAEAPPTNPVIPDPGTSTPNPTPQQNPTPAFTDYIVQSGDTLSGISKSLYGRASLWQHIADANPDVNPNRLRPGTTLKIPPPPSQD